MKRKIILDIVILKILPIIAIIVGLVVLITGNHKSLHKDTIIELSYSNDTIDTEIKSLEVWGLINAIKLEHPAVCFEHVKWESGHFKDTLVVYNNLFGMQYAKKRPSLQTGYVVINGIKWGVYKKWEDSVYDYLIWQILYARALSEEQYKEKLYKVYGAKNIHFIK